MIHGEFIFGALGYFKLGAPLEGFQRLMSYKSALHVLATYAEQVVPIHKYITVFILNSLGIRNHSHVSRPPYPQLGGHAVTWDPKFRA